MDDYARRARDREHQRLAVPPRQDPTSARTCCRDRAAETGAWIVYVNAVGGQDELVFDGGSLVMAPDGTIAAARSDVRRRPARGGHRRRSPRSGRTRDSPGPRSPTRSTGRSCSAPHDYVRKNGFREVVLGLSGGIDSALVAVLAADALGPDAVRALAMPSLFSIHAQPRGRRWRSPGARHPARRPADRRRVRRLRGGARRPLRRARRGRHRGEPAGAHPGQPPDGDVEQVRLDRARDREQVRVRRRVLDALRRHGRRLRAHQRRARRPSSTSSAAWRNARPRASGAPIPDRVLDEAAVGGAPARPAGHGLAPPLRRARSDRRGLRRGRPRTWTRSSTRASTDRDRPNGSRG